MLSGWFGRGFSMALGAATVAAALSAPTVTEAATRYGHASHATAGRHGFSAFYPRHGFLRRYAGGGGLQCVPFARENSGIELSGNAGTWWDNADGLYERGARPEVGSVLNFRATGRMRMGHVAVVTNVVDSRHIEIDHANWGGPGRVSRNMDVVDVSPANDWTAVRVALSPTDETLGSVYPTFGFIYDRPDHGTMVANTGIIRGNAPTPIEVADAGDDDAPRSYRRGASFRHVSRHGRVERAGVIRTSARVSARPHGRTHRS